jgi:quaternary ammonium compound-resistance protein SugE
MHWTILILAGFFECAFTFCLGKANIVAGKAQAAWYFAFVMFYVLSMLFLSKATKVIPIGTAYPIWTGIGAVGTVLIGILVFREPATFWRMFFIFTLIASVIGLKMVH